MLNQTFKEYLMQQNDLCNVHINQQSSKQDHAVTFYVSILTLFVASKQFLISPNQSLLNVILSAVMVLIGVVFYCYICSYVHWHERFINCARIISYLVLCEIEINNYEALRHQIHRALGRIKSKGVYYGSQTILLTGYIIISSIPCAFLLFDINGLFGGTLSWPAISVIYLFSLLSLFFFAFFLYKQQLNKASKNLTFILDFIDEFPE